MSQQVSSEVTEATIPDGTEIPNINAGGKPFIDILKERITTSNVLTYQEVAEILKVADTVNPPELLEAWFKSRVGDEKFSLLFPKKMVVGIDTEQSTDKIIPTVSEGQSGGDSEIKHDSIGESVLRTVKELILSAKDIFPESAIHRITYIRYILTTTVLIAGLGAGYVFLDKHPEAASASKSSVIESGNKTRDIGAGGVNIQGVSGSGNITTVHVSNGVGKEEISAVDKRLSGLEEKLES